MTPPADDRHDDLYDEAPPRSIFAATWFRALLVLIVIGVIGAVAVPYILDAMNPPAKPSVASRSTSTPPSPPTAVTPSPSAPASPATPSDRAPDTTVQPDRAPADRPATAMPATPRKPFTADKSPTAEKPATSEKMTGAPSAASDKAAEKPAEKKDARVAAATSDAKPGAEPKSATATKRAATSSASTATAPRGGTAGAWWVQVGAFRDESTAKKVAAKLREQNYKVEESVRGGGESSARLAAIDKSAPAASAPNPAGADLYDVFGSGAVIKPSLPLRDAVALSKDLAVEGFKVQVRRAAGAAAAPQPARRAAARRPEPSASGETLYRVRVGAFPDRATAVSTLKELEAKGYKPFIARGGP